MQRNGAKRLGLRSNGQRGTRNVEYPDVSRSPGANSLSFRRAVGRLKTLYHGRLGLWGPCRTGRVVLRAAQQAGSCLCLLQFCSCCSFTLRPRDFLRILRRTICLSSYRAGLSAAVLYAALDRKPLTAPSAGSALLAAVAPQRHDDDVASSGEHRLCSAEQEAHPTLQAARDTWRRRGGK